MKKTLFCGALLLMLATSVVGAERTTVCAKYRAGYGWSKGYSVEATILDGNELNQKTRSYDYAPYSTYVVIFWGQGEASVIKMRMMYVTAYPSEGEDQRGRAWKIADTPYCL